MVKNLKSLERKLRLKIPRAVERQLRQQMAVAADRIVQTAQGLVPQRHGDLKNSIGWVWGNDAPKGSISLGSLFGSGSGDSDLVITIFAGDDEAFYARWVEFGTQPHSTTSGADISRNKRQSNRVHGGTPPQPFFFPAYRLNRRSAKSRISRAIKKGLAEGSR